MNSTTSDFLDLFSKSSFSFKGSGIDTYLVPENKDGRVFFAINCQHQNFETIKSI